MKITTDNQQPAPAGESSTRSSAAKNAEVAAPQKAPRRKDSVELSSALDAELRTREIGQAERVEEIKARVAAGEYRVAARAVAEKIVSGRSDN